MGGRRYEDTQNGYGKRIFRLEVLMYVLLAKMSFMPDAKVQDFVITAWRAIW